MSEIDNETVERVERAIRDVDGSLSDRQCAEYARAAIAAMPSPWRPIETAPPDTAVLLYGFGYAVGHYNTLAKQWVGYGWDSPETLAMNTRQPTYWRPLPAPPEA